MKKILKYLFIIISCFTINIQVANAEGLNCSQYLSKGDTGNSVKVLQQMLNKTTNCSLDVDGIYGKLTKKCVKKFQNKYNLSSDGIVGPKTCNKLNRVLNKKSVTTNTNKTRRRSTSSTKTKSVNTNNNTDTNIKINSANKKDAYVMASVVNVRKDASTSSRLIAKVRRGKKVEVIGTNGEWSYVVVNSNISGYIKSDLLTNSLIIVDISDQKLYFYKNNKIVLRTSVVTGMKGSHDTPIGRYVLRTTNLKRSITLRGVNDNGSSYASYVEYWMPFIMGRGIGFHDASWRSNKEYTNNRYTYDGSHGCVNMKTESAKKLYNNITSDTLVIIQR